MGVDEHAGTRSVQGLILSTKRYVRADLSEYLKVPAGAPVRIELPIKGRRNLLWLVALGDTKVMLHCFLPDQKPRMDKHVLALKLMENNGVRAPRLLHTMTDPDKYGAYFATSEFVEGVGRGGDQQLSMEEISCLAEQAALLHRIRNEAWGPLVNPSIEPYFGYHMNQVKRYLAGARKTGMISDAQRAELHSWFSRWESRFSGISQFSLVHGDLHPNNVLFHPNGSCCLVDTDQFSWNLGMQDVAMIHDRACRGDLERVQRFDQIYLSHLDEEQRRMHLLLYPFFAAFYRLGAVMRAVRAIEKKQDSITTPRALKKDTWKEMLDICGIAH